MNMVPPHSERKLSETSRFPVELLTKITNQAPISSLWALCSTSRIFYELTVQELYRDAWIRCTGSNSADTKALVRRAQKWCHTVMQNPDKAALVKSITVTKLPR